MNLIVKWESVDSRETIWRESNVILVRWDENLGPAFQIYFTCYCVAKLPNFNPSRNLTAILEKKNGNLPSFRLIQGVQVLTQSGNDALILVGIFAEDILDHHKWLLGLRSSLWSGLGPGGCWHSAQQIAKMRIKSSSYGSIFHEM